MAEFQKAPCENMFRAITNALLLTKACDCTGKVAFACTRHGCFVLNSLAELFKGEQQKNIDYALLQAIKTTHIEPEQGLFLIYDIICTWIVYLYDQIGHLLPVGIIIDQAIDLFHVHGHKDICFFHFATTFVPGAAVVASQILESLWSSLNVISSLVQTASLAHREEVLDDHATDSNYKNMLGITDILCNRYTDAIIMVGLADSYFLEFSGDIAQATLNEWEDEIQSVEAMQLADIKRIDTYGAWLPTSLTDDTGEEHGTDTSPDINSGTAAEMWLQLAKLIEENQIEIQDKVRRLGSVPRDQDQQIVMQLHQALIMMLAELKI
ncbi:hypothetical protein CVT25_005223 [Psilocybe cyanescens]|uniref:Uncharacterized protein n=1 Tax=Psilocybe cyanescens TaxID=93625 RepID=A0A409XC67_PSICY|nr:hypothetical protein CVT25_005223 [Psilocybe cyanescens]